MQHNERPSLGVLRLGDLLVRPGRGLAGIVERKSGGVRDAFLLVLLATLVFRLPALVRAAMSLARVSTSAALTQVLSVLGAEVRTAAMVAVPASLIILLFAGRGRRDPALSLELGSACYVPYFFVWLPLRLLDLDAFLGYSPELASRTVRYLAWGVVALYVILSLRVLRGASQFAKEPVSPSRSLLVGWGALALLGFALILNGAWCVRHFELLRPLGRGDRAPDFTLPRVNGDGDSGDMRLSSLRGHVVLLDFWATWCPPCLAMLPTLDELYGEWQPRGAEFLGINAEGAQISREELLAFLRKRPSAYPVVLDDQEVGGIYGVFSIPHIVIVRRDGTVARVFVGQASRQQLADALADASK